MFSRLCSSTKVLASRASSWYIDETHQRYHRRFRIPATLAESRRPTRVIMRNMASGNQQFPPQKQEAQPGKEHVMEPTPQFTSHDYKPSNKLRVWFTVHISV